MKKKLIAAAVVIASGVASWQVSGIIKQMNKDPIDIELNRKVCIKATTESVADFVKDNDYQPDEKAKRKAALVISQQCKFTVYNENGEPAREPKTLKAAGNMFIDGLDYEEALIVRYAKKRAEFNGAVIAKMGIKEVSAWVQKLEDSINEK